MRTRSLLTACDADERVIDPLRKAGKNLVIPPKFNRNVTRAYDEDKAQHLIENFFAKLKQCRAIAYVTISAPPTSSARSISPPQSPG